MSKYTGYPNKHKTETVGERDAQWSRVFVALAKDSSTHVGLLTTEIRLQPRWCVCVGGTALMFTCPSLETYLKIQFMNSPKVLQTYQCLMFE